MARIVWGEAILWASFGLLLAAYCLEFDEKLIPAVGFALIAAIAVRALRMPTGDACNGGPASADRWLRYGLPLCAIVALGLSVSFLDHRITDVERAIDSIGYAVDDVNRAARQQAY